MGGKTGSLGYARTLVCFTDPLHVFLSPPSLHPLEGGTILITLDWGGG